MRIFYFSFLFIFVSCLKDVSKQYDIQYDGDKIVINGYIDTKEGCVVYVSKSISSSATSTLDKLELNDARVYLIEDGNLIIELESMGKGLFKSDGFTPKIDKKYAIKATSNTLKTVESESVVLPDSAQITNFRMIKDSITFNIKSSIFYFKLIDSQPFQRNYFKIDAVNDSTKTAYNDLLQYFDNLNINTLECDFDSDYNSNYFSDKCFDNIYIDAKYIVQYGRSNTKVTEISFIVAQTSKEYFEYSQSLVQPFNKIRAFIEPQLLYTNIKGGYGIFYAQNAKKYKFKL